MVHGEPCDHCGGVDESRPVDAAGLSSRQSGAALLAAGRDDGPSCASLHPLPEAVLPGSTPGVGLERTLHKWSPAGIERASSGRGAPRCRRLLESGRALHRTKTSDEERPATVGDGRIGSAADRTGPMDRDESRTDHVSARQATGQLTDAPTVTTASDEIPASRSGTSNPNAATPSASCPQFPPGLGSLIHPWSPERCPHHEIARFRALSRKKGTEQARCVVKSGLARRHPQAATLPRPQRGRSGPTVAVFRSPTTFPQHIQHLWTT